MAKIELRMIDVFGHHFITAEKKTIQNHFEKQDVIMVQIRDYNGYESWVYLDKSTAIRLSKQIRTEINKITESEVSNG